MPKVSTDEGSAIPEVMEALPWSRPTRMLNEMAKTISMSHLAKNATRIAQDIENAGTVYRITSPAAPPMLLVSQAYVQSLRATVDFMKRHPNWEREMDANRSAVRAGRGVSLDVIMKERGLQGHAEGHPGTSRSKRASSGTSRRRVKDR